MRRRQGNPTADDFVKSLDRGMRKKRITLLIMLGILAVVVATVAIVGMSIRRSNRINLAKNAISQLDIQSTYKEHDTSFSSK